MLAVCLQAAVDMMRSVLNKIDMDGVVIIGEGEKDEVQLMTPALSLTHDSLNSALIHL